MRPGTLKHHVESDPNLKGFGYAVSLYEALKPSKDWHPDWLRLCILCLKRIKEGAEGIPDKKNKNGKYIWLPGKKIGIAVFFKPQESSSTDSCLIYDIQVREKSNR